MNLPKIDLDSLPGLDAVQGLFGSLSNIASASVDDRIVVLMVYLYDHINAPTASAGRLGGSPGSSRRCGATLRRSFARRPRWKKSATAGGRSHA